MIARFFVSYEFSIYYEFHLRNNQNDSKIMISRLEMKNTKFLDIIVSFLLSL